ncbi:MAG: endonuclease/exonuclease/phosphatase family protein, partial [bacterium]
MAIKILSWNVNGYRAVFKKDFTGFLNGHKPDILALQETKACPDQLTEEAKKPAGYSSSWNCAERKGYSGVALLYKNQPLRITNGFGL